MKIQDEVIKDQPQIIATPVIAGQENSIQGS